MKQLFIVANFKSNKSRSQIEAWMDIFDKQFKEKVVEGKTVILAPAMPSVLFVSNRLLAYKESFALAVQNISPFPPGAFTGEVSTENLEGFNVQYTIIGHSERRKMGETDEMVNEKIARAIEGKITPIVCVSNKEQTHNLQFPHNMLQPIIAFEPLDAIGTGKPEDPQSANDVAQKIKNRLGNVRVLYGGSVTAENVHAFTAQEQIDGVLVGGASLDAKSFSAIIQNA